MVDDMVSDIEWQAKLAEESANFSRIKEALELMIPRYALFARQYRLYYEALMSAGFTAEQSLQIIKVHGWIPK